MATKLGSRNYVPLKVYEVENIKSVSNHPLAARRFRQPGVEIISRERFETFGAYTGHSQPPLG